MAKKKKLKIKFMLKVKKFYLNKNIVRSSLWLINQKNNLKLILKKKFKKLQNQKINLN